MKTRQLMHSSYSCPVHSPGGCNCINITKNALVHPYHAGVGPVHALMSERGIVPAVMTSWTAVSDTAGNTSALRCWCCRLQAD